VASSRASAQPAAVRAIAEKARDRLSGRYRRLTPRGKFGVVAIAAVARESLGFIWAIAHAAAPAAAAVPGAQDAGPRAPGAGRGSSHR
jgi:hypothetical protein